MARSIIPSLFGGALAGQTDPFVTLQQQVNRLFDDVFRGAGGFGELAAASPRLNISETDQDFRIEAELPGVPEDAVEVILNEDVLTIKGEKKAERSEQQESYHVMERSYGSFARSVRLPFAVNPEDVSASCQNGVLSITIPKNAAQEKARRIEIHKGGGAPAGAIPAGGSQAAGQGSQTTH